MLLKTAIGLAARAGTVDDVVADAQDKGREAADAVREVSDTFVDAIDEFRKARPYTTLAMVAGRGILFGAMWRRYNRCDADNEGMLMLKRYDARHSARSGASVAGMVRFCFLVICAPDAFFSLHRRFRLAVATIGRGRRRADHGRDLPGMRSFPHLFRGGPPPQATRAMLKGAARANSTSVAARSKFLAIALASWPFDRLAGILPMAVLGFVAAQWARENRERRRESQIQSASRRHGDISAGTRLRPARGRARGRLSSCICPTGSVAEAKFVVVAEPGDEGDFERPAV